MTNLSVATTSEAFKPITGSSANQTTGTTIAPAGATIPENPTAEEYQALERTLERMVDIRPIAGKYHLNWIYDE